MNGAPEKPNPGFYLDIHLQLLRRIATFPIPPKQPDRDAETMMSRTANEGLSFLTKTLPKLGKALDQGLVAQRFTPLPEFKAQKGRSTPEFLQVYFNRVFGEDGRLLESACVESISVLRQVLFFAYKLEMPYTAETEAATLQSFVETDNGLALLDFSDAESVLTLASRITEGIFADFEFREIIPKHGPGAVSTGERLEQKWNFSRLFDSIHQVYPYYEYFVVGGWRELGDRYEWYKKLARQETGTAKVLLVPKDSRGPRLISAEPLEFQWVQQGLGRKMVEFFEGSCELTMGQINFTNQEINRQLALSSSADGKMSTLDLKDASDRVSLELVRRVFKRTPGLLRALEACRTSATALPSGEVLTLRKYAPMGSALCFPVEAYVFWSIMVATIVLETGADIRKVARSVFVYGDDIIVSVADAERCITALESVGLRVNLSKCCIRGLFRESCGMDAFNGVQVTPSRLRKPWTGRSSDGTAFASYVSLANDLGEKGYTSASGLLFEYIQLCFGRLPYASKDSGYPGINLPSSRHAEIANLRSGIPSRWSSRYQRLEFRVKFLDSPKLDTSLDSWPRLLRNSVSQAGLEPSKVVVPRSTKIKRGWRAA